MLRKNLMTVPKDICNDSPDPGGDGLHPQCEPLDIENEGESSLLPDAAAPAHLGEQQARWLPALSSNLPVLAACYVSALTTGATTYAFSFYSNALKSSLRLSQNELDTLSSSTFCAGVLSWVPGMAVDAFGARASMALGGAGNTATLLLYWLVATERWRVARDWLVPLLSLLGVLTFVGCALVTGSVFKVIVQTCGCGTKGKAVGCAKGYVGVGSGVYVCLFAALFGPSDAGPAATLRKLAALLPGSSALLQFTSDLPNPELNSLNFLLMASILSFVAATLPALLLLPKHGSNRHCPDGTRSIHFRVIYAGLIALGMWVVGTSLLELRDEARAASGTANNDAANGGKLSPALWSDMDAQATDFPPNDSTASFPSMPRNLLTQSLSSPERHWGTAFFLLLLWWGPSLSLLFIPPRKSNNENNPALSSSSPNTEEEEIFLQENSNSSLHSKNDNEAPAAETRNYTMTQMLKTIPAWLLAWTCVILVGAGTVMTNNIGQMTEALGFDPDLTSASLALFSAAQAASRVATGSISEAALGWKLPKLFRCCSATLVTSPATTTTTPSTSMPWTNTSEQGRGLPRPAFLVVASLVSAASHFALAAATTEQGFALGVTLSGVAFGMVWPLMVLITGEVFGTRNVGANYMFYDGFSSAFGTLLLSKFVAQYVYDEHIVHEGDDTTSTTNDMDDGNFKCYGTECFRMTNIIVAFLSLTCIASSFGLMYVTKDVYGRR